MKKIMTIFGTRPEAIKMAPVILKLAKYKKEFKTINVVTAQHREMLDQVLDTFNIIPDYDLNIMKPKQTLSDITSNVLNKLDGIILKEMPDLILVHGDTSTTLAASLSAFYHSVPIGHVEAGLRTWDKYSPYPEEMNRQLTDDLADLYFAPTEQSRKNLLKENHDDKKIFITGNTAIDALKYTVSENYSNTALPFINNKRKFILLTMHRRENQGSTMENVFKAIKSIIDIHSDIELVYPVHLSPNVKAAADKIFSNDSKVHLIPPLDVVDFHNLAAKSYFIMTDSGGVQEEAPSLGKPVLVLRDETERPEGVTAGTLKLIGTNPETVKENMEYLLSSEQEYDRMASAKNPYGDGQASNRIISAIRTFFQG